MYVSLLSCGDAIVLGAGFVVAIVGGWLEVAFARLGVEECIDSRCVRWAIMICDISESEDDDELVSALVARVSRERNCWSKASRSLSVLLVGIDSSKLNFGWTLRVSTFSLSLVSLARSTTGTLEGGLCP